MYLSFYVSIIFYVYVVYVDILLVYYNILEFAIYEYFKT